MKKSFTFVELPSFRTYTYDGIVPASKGTTSFGLRPIYLDSHELGTMAHLYRHVRRGLYKSDTSFDMPVDMAALGDVRGYDE
jgi:hypothetical protein